jgi:O-antigen/teichoic acid export membrane protein
VKGIKEIIAGFLERNGSYVFVATILARLLSFSASWIALQLLTEQKLGLVIFAYSFIVFLIPVGGFGLDQGYIRYAALMKNSSSKNQLFVYTFKKGIILSFLFAIILALSGQVTTIIPKESKLYFFILSFSLVSYYILSMLKSYFRIQHKNKIFAYLEITFNIILVLLVSVLSYFYKEVGYSFAIVLAPILASILFFSKINLKKTKVSKLKIIDFKFWRYGVSAGLANVATQLLFALDLILIGYLLIDPKMVTHYKYISLIPFSLLFLPQVLITTDFVKITEQIHNKQVIKNYIKNYWILFALISGLIVLISFIFTRNILSIFQQDYTMYVDAFQVLIIGIVGILLFRGLFGNLLSALGKAHINYWIAIFSLSINLISNLYFIPKYGILGAAITSAVVMWLSGVLSFGLFWFFYKKTTQ